MCNIVRQLNKISSKLSCALSMSLSSKSLGSQPCVHGTTRNHRVVLPVTVTARSASPELLVLTRKVAGMLTAARCRPSPFTVTLLKSMTGTTTLPPDDIITVTDEICPPRLCQRAIVYERITLFISVSIFALLAVLRRY